MTRHSRFCIVQFACGENATDTPSVMSPFMKFQVGPSPLLAEDRIFLSEEFVTLCMHADTVTAKLSERPQQISQNDVWYKLLTDDSYYKHYKKVNALELQFNEAVVEVEVSNLKQTSTETLALKQRTTEMLNFISTKLA